VAVARSPPVLHQTIYNSEGVESGSTFRQRSKSNGAVSSGVRFFIIAVVVLWLGGGGVIRHGRYGGAGLGCSRFGCLISCLLWLFGGLGGMGRLGDRYRFT